MEEERHNTCNNPQDLMGDDIAYDEKLVILMFDDGNNSFNCYTRQEFENMMISSYREDGDDVRLVIWTQGGQRIESEPLFKEAYTGQFIDNSLIAYRRSNAFFAFKRGDFRIGTAFGVSAIHGSISPVWSVCPVTLEKVLHENVGEYKNSLHAKLDEIRASVGNDVRQMIDDGKLQEYLDNVGMEEHVEMEEGAIVGYWPNLKQLVCSNCASLTSIPPFHSVEKIDCSNNVTLQTIGSMNKLTSLKCENTPMLRVLPFFPSLQELDAQDKVYLAPDRSERPAREMIAVRRGARRNR